ncbi:metallophosphoesterase family protein [Thermoflavimicrobium daqui]|uniref:Metallophosphoesterase n=1 Tax=Thermoflavimicrobium daqui TaxID=2137476 RepID=A0A364K7T0_9BACL|nr:metallophosphoesterase family protein [Thermoflavimicrobium daqui]RAL26355.1 metallophosphoesterase [Thermoflavimicrobium daqui]
MRSYAVITDIHGNYPALATVLKEIAKLSVDQIFCLGDMIGIGPYSNEVLETVFSLDNITIITGNHDEAVYALVNNQPYPVSHLKEKEHHRWIADQLSVEHAHHLSKLPRWASIENSSIHLVHFHLQKQKEYAHISENPYTSTGKAYPVPEIDMKKIFQDYTNHALVLFGHVHDTYQFSIGQTLFFNPGSLGCNHQPYARFGLVKINDQNVQADFQAVWYDKDEYVRSIQAIQYPDYQLILQIFFGV